MDNSETRSPHRDQVTNAADRIEVAADRIEVAVTEDPAAAPSHKAGAGRLILMRDANNPDGPVLAFTEAEWRAFIAGVKDGEFDDLA